MQLFKSEEKSTFKYWFAHWCAYNMVALNLKCWKFKYLFHDFEKPWLRLFLPYEKVRNFHRRNNKHHLTYKNPSKIDWEAVMLDWECGRFTKADCPRNCREEIESLKERKPQYYETAKEHLIPLCDKFNI